MTRKKMGDFSDLLYLHRQMRQFTPGEMGVFEESSLGWSPATDICETATEVILVMEIPGVLKDDIEVFLEDKRLTVKGLKRAEVQGESECYLQVERAFGEFRRFFHLDRSVDTDKMNAVVQNGTLTVKLKKLVTRRILEVNKK